MSKPLTPLSFVPYYWKKWTAFKLSIKAKSEWKYRVISFAQVLIEALILALLIRQFAIQTSIVPTPSMVPTLKVRDRLFVNKFIYHLREPQRGDIIVFKSPNGDGKDYVKRCIGLPGDTVEIKQGNVFVNDTLFIVPGVKIQRNQYDYQSKLTVPKNSYYMLGDNRPNSQDSRFWGFVTRDMIQGNALFTFWPLSQMRVLR